MQPSSSAEPPASSGAVPEPEATLSSAPPPVGDLPYAKPNLVLKDPDPYAFANRIGRLVIVFGLLATIAAGPYLLGQFSYYWRLGHLKADYEIAGDQLTEAASRMGDFNRVSRLIAARVSPAVVSISREGSDQRGQGDGQGSGVIVDTSGFVVTNYHVVHEAESLLVQLADGRITDAEIVGADPATDLALLSINLPDLIAADWGDSDAIQVGDMVWAVGSPFGLARSMTFGIVSAKERRSSGSVATSSVYQEYLQTDVAINPGNSGGPLVDLEGKVVGINTAIIGRSYAGVSFAIPSELAKEKIERLKSDGWIERAFLGISPRTVPEEARGLLGLERNQGVLVASVEQAGPAARAGIRPGDIILAWNGIEASDPTLLSREIAATPVGSEAQVRLKRRSNGSTRELALSVRVGRSPFNDRFRPTR